ncbi:MAG TPA: hypothetical protein VLW45_12160, partial [Pelomicrobium sp.]|nr:hypothetical protein [Pelomicrobium sp.]
MMKKAVTRNLLAALGACALLSAGAVLAKGPAGGKGPPPFDCKVELQSPQQCATEFHVIWNPEVS